MLAEPESLDEPESVALAEPESLDEPESVPLTEAESLDELEPVVETETLSDVVLLVVSAVCDSVVLSLIESEAGVSATESAVANVLAEISDAMGVIIITNHLSFLRNKQI